MFVNSPRRCTRCRLVEPRAEFGPRRDSVSKQDVLCRPCRSAYGKEHYAANRQRYIDLAAERQRAAAVERTHFLVDYFATHPCVDCGEDDPVVLEFDHLRDKAFDIGGKLTSQPWAAVLAEIEKCDVVCANCHRRRTSARRGTLRWRMTRGTV